METVKLYKLKKGEKFRTLDIHGEPETGILIKGRPHTDYYGNKLYVTFIYAPGEPYDHSFAGHMNCDIDVVRVTD